MVNKEKATPVESVEPAPVSVPETFGNAGESGDPAVQSLIAERAAAVLNGDTEALKVIDSTLRGLGFA